MVKAKVSKKSKAATVKKAENKKTVVPSKKEKAVSSKKINDFRQLYDDDYKIPKEIEEAIAKIGKDSWMYERDFVIENGMSTNKVSLYREMFEPYIVLIRKESKRIWCGSVELADQLRKIVR